MKALKKIAVSALLAGTLLGGCAYGGVAAVGETVVITRNDALLFGLLRKVFVCQVAPTGVSECSANEAP